MDLAHWNASLGEVYTGTELFAISFSKTAMEAWARTMQST
jgi:hypothetical protein